MSDSTRRTSRGKVGNKPTKNFPLSIHKGTGYWCKKVRGSVVYFGKVADDPHGVAALEAWNADKEDLLAGRKPRRRNADGTTVKEACDRFLDAKESYVESGELTRRSFEDYKETCTRVANAFSRNRLVDDLAPEDFAAYRAKLSKKWGAATVYNEIGRVRVLFRWVYEAGLIEKPLRYGPDFKRPSAKRMRQVRQSKPPKLFTSEELRTILAAAGAQLKAMILLGINCGLGNSDLAQAEFRHLDLLRGWLDFPRPKTAVLRRCPLWPETVEAIQAAIDARPTPHDEAWGKLVFITKYGRPWATDETRNSPLSAEFAKLLDELELRRDGRNFYALRHTVETIGGGAKDQVAVDRIMGHAPAATDMAERYRESIDDARLAAVAEHVRKWLWPDDTTKESKPSAATKGKASKAKPSSASSGDTSREVGLRLFVG